MNTDQIVKLVSCEIDKIEQVDLIQVIQNLVILPRKELCDWDYGKSDEQVLCWVVAEHLQSNTGIAYSEQGFGPKYSWGLLSIDGPHLSIGTDASWFTSLEDAVRQAPFWRGKNPDGYEVQ